jgi:hypothetical protein
LYTVQPVFAFGCFWVLLGAFGCFWVLQWSLASYPAPGQLLCHILQKKNTLAYYTLRFHLFHFYTLWCNKLVCLTLATISILFQYLLEKLGNATLVEHHRNRYAEFSIYNICVCCLNGDKSMNILFLTVIEFSSLVLGHAPQSSWP